MAVQAAVRQQAEQAGLGQVEVPKVSFCPHHFNQIPCCRQIHANLLKAHQAVASVVASALALPVEHQAGQVVELEVRSHTLLTYRFVLRRLSGSGSGSEGGALSGGSGGASSGNSSSGSGSGEDCGCDED